MLRATTGTWANDPTGFTFQWRRCNRAGRGCTAVAGAVAATYPLRFRDVGSTLRIRVRASSGGGTTIADSAPTRVVTARPVVNLAPNASFERRPAPAYVSSGDATFSWAADRFRSSAHSLKISAGAPGVSCWRLSGVAARVGTSYGAAVWVRTSALRGRVSLSLVFRTENGIVRSGQVGAAGGSAWRPLTLVRTAPAGTTRVHVRLCQSGTGSSWWDDVRLTGAVTPD